MAPAQTRRKPFYRDDRARDCSPDRTFSTSQTHTKRTPTNASRTRNHHSPIACSCKSPSTKSKRRQRPWQRRSQRRERTKRKRRCSKRTRSVSFGVRSGSSYCSFPRIANRTFCTTTRKRLGASTKRTSAIRGEAGFIPCASTKRTSARQACSGAVVDSSSHEKGLARKAALSVTCRGTRGKARHRFSGRQRSEREWQFDCGPKGVISIWSCCNYYRLDLWRGKERFVHTTRQSNRRKMLRL